MSHVERRLPSCCTRSCFTVMSPLLMFTLPLWQVHHGDGHGLSDGVPRQQSLHLQLWDTFHRLFWVKENTKSPRRFVSYLQPRPGEGGVVGFSAEEQLFCCLLTFPTCVRTLQPQPCVNKKVWFEGSRKHRLTGDSARNS